LRPVIATALWGFDFLQFNPQPASKVSAKPDLHKSRSKFAGEMELG